MEADFAVVVVTEPTLPVVVVPVGAPVVDKFDSEVLTGAIVELTAELVDDMFDELDELDELDDAFDEQFDTTDRLEQLLLFVMLL